MSANMQQPEFSKDASVVALRPAFDRIKAFAKGLIIKTADGYNEAAQRLKVVKAALTQIEDARTRITKPINESLRETNRQAKEAAAPWLAEEVTIKRAMISFADEQERQRREEQRLLNEKAEKERQRLLEHAQRNAAKGNEAKAESFEERAAAVVAPVVQREAPKVEGVSIPKVWTFEITDSALIPREYLVIDETRIRKVVGALKGETNIPGVRVFQQSRIASSAA